MHLALQLRRTQSQRTVHLSRPALPPGTIAPDSLVLEHGVICSTHNFIKQNAASAIPTGPAAVPCRRIHWETCSVSWVQERSCTASPSGRATVRRRPSYSAYWDKHNIKDAFFNLLDSIKTPCWWFPTSQPSVSPVKGGTLSLTLVPVSEQELATQTMECWHG